MAQNNPYIVVFPARNVFGHTPAAWSTYDRKAAKASRALTAAGYPAGIVSAVLEGDSYWVVPSYEVAESIVMLASDLSPSVLPLSGSIEVDGAAGHGCIRRG